MGVEEYGDGERDDREKWEVPTVDSVEGLDFFLLREYLAALLSLF